MVAYARKQTQVLQQLCSPSVRAGLTSLAMACRAVSPATLMLVSKAQADSLRDKQPAKRLLGHALSRHTAAVGRWWLPDDAASARSLNKGRSVNLAPGAQAALHTSDAHAAAPLSACGPAAGLRRRP